MLKHTVLTSMSLYIQQTEF